MNLPLGQNELVEAVIAANPNTIVVVQSGNPVLLPWADKARAIVWAGFPGQEGGQAIADILMGDVNPSGRLPFSFPASEAQLPFPELPNLGADFFKPVTVRYHEGSDVGYRWFARKGSKPLFAFGHGLSYTEFRFQDLKLTQGAVPTATVRVRNIGVRAGTVVPQLYVTARPQGPLLRLVSYGTVHLKSGEERTIRLAIEPRILADFDAGLQRWHIAGGRYRMSVGSASDKLSVTRELTLKPVRLDP
jgi:beta-glucosidase